MKGLGEVIDDLQLRVARLSKLLHIGAAIRVGRSGQSDGQNEPCPQCAKPFSCHRVTSSLALPPIRSHKPEENGKNAAATRLHG